MTFVRRGGLVHDVGQVGVPNGIWDRRAGLGPTDWEQVRLHTLWGERALSAAPSLREVASLVGAHHERLDGSGYHRQLDGTRIDGAARLLAATDAYVALGDARPYRPALDPTAAAGVLRDEVRAGRLDPLAVDAILAASGYTSPPARRSWPRGLSDREVEVLRLISR